MSSSEIIKIAFCITLGSVTAGAAIQTGPAIGEKVPDFSGPDQNGTIQSLKTIAGPKGAMLVFYRSADW